MLFKYSYKLINFLVIPFSIVLIFNKRLSLLLILIFNLLIILFNI